MKIPSKINICGIIYDVAFVKKPDNQLGSLDYYGVIDSEKSRIEISDGIDKQRQTQTFIHEILHGIATNYAVKLDEDEVERLSNGIYAVLKSNNLLKD